MNVKVLSNKKEELRLEFEDETETMTQLLATQVWKEGKEAAAVREHPFIENPKLIVMGKSPERVLKKAAIALEEQCDEFKEEFRRALEK